MATYVAVEEYGVKQLTLAAPSAADLRDTMILGPSGLLAQYPEGHPNKPTYIAGRSILEWPSGARGRLMSAEAAERARGLNSEWVWCEEIGSWADKDFFDQLMFGLRIGMASCVITTTPRATPLVIDLYERKDADVKLITGGTMENQANLSKAFINQITATYKDTRLYDQEILGILVLRSENSLWSPEVIDRNKVSKNDLPDFEQYIVGVDPALSANVKTSDQTGIIVAGLGTDKNIYILGDWSGHHQPNQWTSIVHALYEKYNNDAPTYIVIESNALGQHTKNIVTRDFPSLPVKEVRAIASKAARAAPVSLLWEQNTVKLVKDSGLQDLEREMLTWSPFNKKSAVDDRVDAMVYAVSHLNPVKKAFTISRELLI